MNFSTEVKFTGETYTDNYTCGLSMHASSSMNVFEITTDNETETVYTRKDGITLTLSHIKSSLSDATEFITTITNNSDNKVTMEMLTSVLLKEIKADKVYRLLSFWSAEGKLKVDTLKELNMEHSWSNHGCRVTKFGNLGSMPVRQYFPFVAFLFL